MVKRTLRLGLLVATLSACGGTDNGRPSGKPPDAGAAALPCDAANGYSTQVFIDFEGEVHPSPGYPDPRVAAVCTLPECQAPPAPFYFNFDVKRTNKDPTDIRPCPSTDMNKTGCDCVVPTRPNVAYSTDPAIGSTLFGRPIDQGGRCGAPGNAMHLQTTNIATCYGPDGRLGWGAGVDITFKTSHSVDAGATGGGGAGGTSADEPHPSGSNGYDASAWDGISFWVRKGNAGSNSTLIVTVADPGTTPEVCSIAEDAEDAKKCDAFGVAVTLTEEWTFVPALFRAMRQKGFGKPSPLGYLDSGNIAKIQLLLGPGDWDLWIDDVAFFREPEANL